jgi:hypothetical protein
MKKIIVEVGYRDFKFDSVEEAVKFAEIASKTQTSKDNITVTIEFTEEEENEV